jgi:hypothetical protein
MFAPPPQPTTYRDNCDRRQRRGQVAQQGTQPVGPHVWALPVHQQPAQGAQVFAVGVVRFETGCVSPGLAGAAACCADIVRMAWVLCWAIRGLSGQLVRGVVTNACVKRQEGGPRPDQTEDDLK